MKLMTIINTVFLVLGIIGVVLEVRSLKQGRQEFLSRPVRIIMLVVGVVAMVVYVVSLFY